MFNRVLNTSLLVFIFLSFYLTFKFVLFHYIIFVNLLSASPTKWSNTFKQFVKLIDWNIIGKWINFLWSGCGTHSNGAFDYLSRWFLILSKTCKFNLKFSWSNGRKEVVIGKCTIVHLSKAAFNILLSIGKITFQGIDRKYYFLFSLVPEKFRVMKLIALERQIFFISSLWNGCMSVIYRSALSLWRMRLKKHRSSSLVFFYAFIICARNGMIYSKSLMLNLKALAGFLLTFGVFVFLGPRSPISALSPLIWGLREGPPHTASHLN